MSYAAIDASRHSGQPVHLIQLDYQATTYRYCTGADDFYDGANTWTANEMKPAKDLNISDNLERVSIQFIVPVDNPIAQLFRIAAIEATIEVNVYEVHLSDTAVDLALAHTGRIMTRRVKLNKNKREATLKSEPLLTAQKRKAIREKIGKLCPYNLYDTTTCRATKTPYSRTIATISGRTLTVNSNPVTSGWLKGGYIETALEKRMVTSHSGTTITVTEPFTTLSVGDSVTLYKGCRKTTSDCETKHSNMDNFGGEPFIPTKNPHDGKMV